jgi:hypothetical protein
MRLLTCSLISALLVASASPPWLVAQEEPVDPLELVYNSLQLTPIELVGKGPFRPGDVIVVKVGIKNIADRSVFVPVNMNYSRPMHLAGAHQFWLEPVAEDAGKGDKKPRVPRGGAIIETPPFVEKDQVKAFDIGAKFSTEGLAPGKYRFIVEYKSLDKKSRVLQNESVEFELQEK